MNFRFLVTVLLLLFSFHSQSQVLQWAKRVGGSLNDNGNNSVVDKYGNLYLTGSFQGSNVDFDPGLGTFLLSSNGLKDGFVVKYDLNGNFKWAFKIGGTSQDEVGDVALDSAGNIVVTGYFRGSGVDFDPSSNNAFLNSNGDSGPDPGYGGDIFVAKYDTSGNYKWAFNVGGPDIGDNGTGICTDKNNDIIITGYLRQVVDFDPSPAAFNLNQSNGTLFLAKYNSAGQFQWAFNTGQGGNIDNTGFKVAADGSNNIVFTGFFQGTNIDFDPSASTNTLSSNGFFDFFVAKYSPTGQYVWAKSAGGSGADVGRSLVIDANNDIYVTGDYSSSSINFNGIAPANKINNNGGNDLFLVKYSAAGQHLWSFGTGGSGSEFGLAICKDDRGNVLIAGAFTGTNVDFDPSSNIIGLSSQGDNDIYAVKYSPSGAYLCSFRVGGFNSDLGKSISSFGNYSYLCGVFNGTNIDFDPTAGSTLLTSSAEDAFFAKYDWTILPPSGTLTGASNCTTGQAQLTFTAASGAGPFTLYINNGSTTTTYTNIQSGIPFSIPPPTAATTYTLTGIKDANLCSAVTPANSTITLGPGGLPVTTSGSAAICKTDSVQLTASGGTTYQWLPAAGLSNSSVSNPKASPAVTTTYKVIVSNAAGCKDSATLTVTIKPSPTISILPANANFCSGDSVQLIATGGATYQWNPAAGLSNAAVANPKASPPVTTNYKLVVTSSDGCKDSVTKQVTKNASPVAGASGAGAICAGDSLQLTASGGTSYQWLPSTGLNNAAIANPKASPAVTTVYKAIVTNSQGCKDSASVTVTLKPKPALIIASAAFICKGDSAQLSASGGASYQWYPTTGLNNPTIAAPKASPAANTVYTVVATGANACVDSARVTVSVNQPPTVSVSANSSVCAGDSVQLSAGGGASYQWSPAAGLSNPASATPKASPATTTTYRVLVYSAANCVDSSFVTITLKPKPVVTATGSASVCKGDSAQLTASGGTAYLWSPSTGLNNPVIANPKASPQANTAYTVTVTGANGCKDSARSQVTVTPIPQPNLGKDTAICLNEDLLLDGTTASGVGYLWSNGAVTPTITVNQPGRYWVRVTVNGCTSTASDTLLVDGLAQPVVALGRDTTICSSDTLRITASGSNIAGYLWNTGSRDSFVLVTNEGIYTVTASNKCGNVTDAITVSVDVCADDLFFPTAFTPNRDRRNDVFKAGYLQGFTVFDYELTVFNRWGQRVFQTNDVNLGWDGKVDGKDQPSGVFVWLAKYRKSTGGKLVVRKGTATLVR